MRARAGNSGQVVDWGEKGQPRRSKRGRVRLLIKLLHSRKHVDFLVFRFCGFSQVDEGFPFLRGASINGSKLGYDEDKLYWQNMTHKNRVWDESHDGEKGVQDTQCTLYMLWKWCVHKAYILHTAVHLPFALYTGNVKTRLIWGHSAFRTEF